MKPRINLLQLLALLSASAALTHLVVVARNDQPLWREDVFRYETAVVPDAYLALDSKSIRVVPVAGKSKTYANPIELYQVHHRVGWEWVRASFYRGDHWEVDDYIFDAYHEYDLSKLSFRSGVDQAMLAHVEGRTQCREQIKALMNDFSPAELRARIAYPNHWMYGPATILFAISGLLFVGARIRKRVLV